MRQSNAGCISSMLRWERAGRLEQTIHPKSAATVSFQPTMDVSHIDYFLPTKGESLASLLCFWHGFFNCRSEGIPVGFTRTPQTKKLTFLCVVRLHQKPWTSKKLCQKQGKEFFLKKNCTAMAVVDLRQHRVALWVTVPLI